MLLLYSMGTSAGRPYADVRPSCPASIRPPEVLALLARQEASHACVRRVAAQRSLHPGRTCFPGGSLPCYSRPSALPRAAPPGPSCPGPRTAPAQPPRALQGSAAVPQTCGALCTAVWQVVVCLLWLLLQPLQLFPVPLGEPGAGRARRTCLSCHGRQQLLRCCLCAV